MKSIEYILILVMAMIVLTSCDKEETANTINIERETVDQTVSENSEWEIGSEHSRLIQTMQVGHFRIGETVPENSPSDLMMRRFLEDDLNYEGQEITHVHNVLFNQIEDVLELIMERTETAYHEDKLIEEMVVLSDYFKTAEGISIGSTVGEFLDTYRYSYAWYDRVHDMVYIEAQHMVGVQFILEEIDYQPKSNRDFEEIKISTLDTASRITFIRVH